MGLGKGPREIVLQRTPCLQQYTARFFANSAKPAGFLSTERTVPGETAERVRADDLRDADWQAIGRCLRRFHDAGVHHADLNAHNVLLDGADRPWVVDFDRGRRREPGGWRDRALQRLGRSLAKVSGGSIAWRDGFARLRAAHGA